MLVEITPQHVAEITPRCSESCAAQLALEQAGYRVNSLEEESSVMGPRETGTSTSTFTPWDSKTASITAAAGIDHLESRRNTTPEQPRAC